MTGITALLNMQVFDGTGQEPYGPGAIVLDGSRIQAIGPVSRVSIPRDAQVLDLAGKTAIPGLIDAHTHVGWVENRFGVNVEDQHPGAVYAFAVARNLEECLRYGYTTIRDAGLCDWSVKRAVSQGWIRGPRMFISNTYISQTGGHGDLRQRHDTSERWTPHRLIPAPLICDGVEQVRWAAREQLRQGADQLKVMAGGGAGSPTDPLDAPQFTLEELAAAVYEAKVVKKPVMAHVYVPEGIKNCVKAGVATIEHGNFLDEESAVLMRQHGAYLVPTLTVFEFISRYGREQGMAETTLEKIELGKAAARQGVEIALDAGLRIGSGSDLYGTNGSRRSWELELKAEVMGPVRALVAATKTNAELLGMGDEFGTLEPGKLADVVVVDGDPLEDITILQDATKIVLVMASGQVVQGGQLASSEAEGPLIMDDPPGSRPPEFCCHPD